jgi:hypothetical protein
MNKSACITGLIAACLLATSLAAEADPIYYNPTTNHWYGLVNAVPSSSPAGTRDWLTAEASAQASGGHLVTINDDPENVWLFDTFNLRVYRGAYIGLYQDPSPGVVPDPKADWKWISGELSSYRNWNPPSEPNDAMGPGSEQFGIMWLNFGLRSGYWNDTQSPKGFNVDDDSFRYGIAEYETNPVPEPVSIVLFGTGLVGISALVRKKAKRS